MGKSGLPLQMSPSLLNKTMRILAAVQLASVQPLKFVHLLAILLGHVIDVDELSQSTTQITFTK